jgi:hypothetical protein
MDPSRDHDHINGFVRELLSSGSMLWEVAADLTEALPVEAYPGEEPAAVVLEMMCGTIATVLGGADPGEVQRATELIRQAGERTIEHLRLACELSRRMHGDDGGRGRSYG